MALPALVGIGKGLMGAGKILKSGGAEKTGKNMSTNVWWSK